MRLPIAPHAHLKLVGLKGVAPSRIIDFKSSRSAVSGYPQAHLKLVLPVGFEPTHNKGLSFAPSTNWVIGDYLYWQLEFH